jgi:hypothetical protein
VILAKDETKVKSWVAWEPKPDVLSGFYESKVDHICVSGFVSIIGEGEVAYNSIMDAFQDDVLGGFVRILMVNTLHLSLPMLVLVINSTYNRSDVIWVRKQWCVIDQLWVHKYLEDIDPIIGHVSDGDSRRRQFILEDNKGKEGIWLGLDWPSFCLLHL